MRVLWGPWGSGVICLMSFTRDMSYLECWDLRLPFICSFTHFPQEVFTKIPFSVSDLEQYSWEQGRFSNAQNLSTHRRFP